jgi:hypothetical protein
VPSLKTRTSGRNWGFKLRISAPISPRIFHDGVQSSRFLLQPHAKGQVPWLKNDLLGRHFQDHPAAICGEIHVANASLFHDYFDNVFLRGHKYQPRFYLNISDQAKEKTLNAAGTILFTSETEEALNQIKQAAKSILKQEWRSLKKKDAVALTTHWPLLLKSIYRYKIDHRTYNSATSRVELGIGCEQDPGGKAASR